MQGQFEQTSEVLKRCIFYILLCLFLSSCEFKWKADDGVASKLPMAVERYDRIESRYLTTGDFSALQQMNIEYPIETRTLIEKVLQLGSVEDYEINQRLLRFYRDSTLQSLILDAESMYANMDDINEQWNDAFGRLVELIPDFPIPRVYAQIGALDQSIVIGDKSIGISLDKYLGEDYALYRKFYSPVQIKTMKRSYIVPDGLSFYLLSLYPMERYDSRSQLEKDLHMGKVMWVVNYILGQKAFDTKYVRLVGRYVRRMGHVDIEELLEEDDYRKMMV